MDKALKKQALEWFEKGKHDIETAQLLLDHQGHLDSIAFHIHQALEKYIKGYLVSLNNKPPRVHDLGFLIQEISLIHPDFLSFLDLCEKVSMYYIDSRYPPGSLARYELSELSNDISDSIKLIEKICKMLEV